MPNGLNGFPAGPAPFGQGFYGWTSRTEADNSPTDPYYSSTKLLLHCDGTDGSTVFTDQTGKPQYAFSGDAHISTARDKFGTASISLNQGAGSGWVDFPNSADWDFGGADFTIECFAQFTTTSGTFQGIINRRTYSGGADGWLFMLSGGTLVFWASTTGSSWNIMCNTSFTPSLNTWYHLAVVNIAGTINVYVNGISLASTSLGGGSIYPQAGAGSSAPLRLGAFHDGSNWFYGFLDEVRITKGVGRYLGPFLVPDAPFPNK